MANPIDENSLPGVASTPLIWDGSRRLTEVVVIDDDAPVRDTIVAMVKRLGHTTAGIDPSHDILATVRSINPAVIVLDLSLGRRDAVQVLKELGEARYPGRILLASGRDAETVRRVHAIGLRHGLQMLVPLTKPISGRDIASSLLGANLPAPSEKPVVLFDLPEALAKGWLEVWYQPKVTLKSRTMGGAEALVRLRHPQMGIIPPVSFIPSSTTDAYEAMTAFVVESVARDWGVLKSRGWPLTLSINASIKMIERPSFLEMIRGAWSALSDRPRLIVEVTEDDLIVDMQSAQEIATQLKLYDVDISIDDFGSGYSSFASLRDLPFSELKLDKSFVLGCSTDPKLRAFVEATAALARQFEVRSVAEGIETAEDLAVVEAAGFDIGQGYIFARPKPIAEFLELLDKLKERQRRRKAGAA